MDTIARYWLIWLTVASVAYACAERKIPGVKPGSSATTFANIVAAVTAFLFLVSLVINMFPEPH